jgi:L-alanine-DL-glutamate epimerase-like enolase superfamily enzyme
MKIIKVESFAIQAPPQNSETYWGSRAWGSETGNLSMPISAEYPTPQRRRYIYSQTIDTVVVRLTTEDGIVGFGESKAPVAPQATKFILDTLLAPIVLGADPYDMTVIWERMYAGMRVRGHSAGFYLEAMSGIDIALWDIVGKKSGEPIAKLLGGIFRNPIRIYASGLPTLPIAASDAALENLCIEAESLRDLGYQGIKLALGRDIDGDLRCARLLRERLGPSFLLYGDAAGVYDRTQAMRVGKELESLDFGFFEMPIPPEDREGYAELARALAIPIALDSLMTRYETLDFLRRGGLDIVQPDVCRAGGITECRRIAELADVFGASFQPHISIGSAIHFAASAHLAASMPNTLTCEYWIGNNPLGNAVLETPIKVCDGYIYAPLDPGLGIHLREDALLQYSKES